MVGRALFTGVMVAVIPGPRILAHMVAATDTTLGREPKLAERRPKGRWRYRSTLRVCAIDINITGDHS